MGTNPCTARRAFPPERQPGAQVDGGRALYLARSPRRWLHAVRCRDHTRKPGRPLVIRWPGASRQFDARRAIGCRPRPLLHTPRPPSERVTSCPAPPEAWLGGAENGRTCSRACRMISSLDLTEVYTVRFCATQRGTGLGVRFWLSTASTFAGVRSAADAPCGWCP